MDVTDECDNTELIAEEAPASAEGTMSGERAPWLTPYRWDRLAITLAVHPPRSADKCLLMFLPPRLC